MVVGIINAREEQHKKITTARATIQFDPYQIENHQHMRHKQKGGKVLFPARYYIKNN